MAHRRSKTFSLRPLTIAVVAVASPATLALCLYLATGDARWRPLAQTVENTSYTTSAHMQLTAIVYWPIDRNVDGATALADNMRKAIRSKGIHAKVSVVGTEGKGYVIYHVNRNVIGPFPLTAAADGVAGAVAAYWRQPGVTRREAS